ncbi:MAG: hypothetical protein JSU72_00405 [Deltaproteobacteria bacterium]|nr:MAG: hypothetical protein JSU72_00405 [Deltaproteobacteria bacterium]
MFVSVFHQRFISFCNENRRRRALELQDVLQKEAIEVGNRWDEARKSLVSLYPERERKDTVARALADPYFNLTMLQKMNIEQFAAEPQVAELSDQQLAKIAGDHLLEWATIFLSIRRDIHHLNKFGQVSGMKLLGSSSERLPEPGWCNYCGGCCEIRGGPPEFAGAFSPPKSWLRYFSGDASKYQRFCPFLFEYFAAGKFFCAIYRVKPNCCWVFEREECEFLQNDLARKRVALRLLG